MVNGDRERRWLQEKLAPASQPKSHKTHAQNRQHGPRVRVEQDD